MAQHKPDWNKIERMYRAGILSVSEIAREFNVHEATIRYHAKQGGWKRDLSNKVRTTARAKLIESLAKVDPNETIENLKNITEDQIVDEAARTQVVVVRQHQKMLGQGHSIAMRMLHELDTTTSYYGELEQMIKSDIAPRRQGALLKAVSLSSRVTTMRDLATAARLWITLERQAFSIVDDKDNSKEQRKLDEMTAEQLREEIVTDAKRLGIELTSHDFEAKTKANGKLHS